MSMEVIVTIVSKLVHNLFRGRIQPTYIGVILKPWFFGEGPPFFRAPIPIPKTQDPRISGPSLSVCRRGSNASRSRTFHLNRQMA